MDLFNHLDEVNNKNSFIKFLTLLRNDYINNITTWENKSIDSYFESIIACLRTHNFAAFG